MFSCIINYNFLDTLCNNKEMSCYLSFNYKDWMYNNLVLFVVHLTNKLKISLVKHFTVLSLVQVLKIFKYIN
jgi:hypothetical protein